MGSEIRIDERGIVVRVVGEVSADVVADLVGRLGSHPDFHPGLPTVWDFSGSEGVSALTAEALRGAGAVLGRIREGGGRPRVALVMPKDADYGIARMFEGINAERLLVELGVFRSLPEATRWVHGEDPAPPETE